MKRLWNLFKTVRSLPKVDIQLNLHHEEGLRMFKYFTKPHPKMPLVSNKTLGVGILPLHEFAGVDAYLESVNGKNSAAYFSRRAEKFGYIFKPIDPDYYANAIHLIHHSTDERQGIPLMTQYLKPILHYPINEYNFYYGVFKNQELVAYLWMVKSGELITLNRLMGHGDYLKDGIMYLLVTSGIREVMKYNPIPKFVMYDTVFGASEGLKLFKKRLGFRPFKVNWKKTEKK